MSLVGFQNIFTNQNTQFSFRSSKRNWKTAECLATLCGYSVDELELPNQFTWSKNDVLEWIKSLGFPQYQNTFQANYINGRTLLLVDASALVKMNIKDFDHIKTITGDIRKMYKIELGKFGRSISLPPQQPETHYKFYKIPTGPVHELCLRTELFKKMKLMGETKIKLNHFEKLHEWLKHIPDFQSIRIGDIKRVNLYFVKSNPDRELELVEKKTSCTCLMPPCECNWSNKEKVQPWRLGFLMLIDEGKYSENVCKKLDLNGVNLMLMKN